MRHVQSAIFKMYEQGNVMANYVSLEHSVDEKGLPPIVSFRVQSDPIKEVGVNGLQAVDMLHYVKCLFESLDEAFHSDYNITTIAHIENAIQAQHLRTKDRQARKVEGQNKL